MKSLLRLIAILVIIGAVVLAWAGNQLFLKTPAEDAQAVGFTVTEGESVAAIAARLEAEGLIASDTLFRAFVRFSGTGGAFRSGAFELKRGMSYAGLAGVLTTPRSATEVELTIPEGYTRTQIGDAVRRVLPHISAADWEAATGSISVIKTDPAYSDLLAGLPKNASLEGYLFPDTYRFLVGASAEDVAYKMLSTFRIRLKATGMDLATPPHGFSLHEMVTLASIVEREVRGSGEMGKVADIFLKRLEIGMALQADSTVNYATGGNRPSATHADLEIDSPYNTYKYPGLPPGPISNPGVAALTAVLKPSENPFYYFLTSPEGEVYYARTFEEHLENRRLYLR